MVLTAPCWLFTVLLLLAALHALLLAAFGNEWSVENRTADPIWVTPLGQGSRGLVLLPHFATRIASYTAPPYGEVHILPGERRRLVIDGYVASDIGGPPGMVVRTASGEHRSCEGTFEEGTVRFIIDDPAQFRRASDEMVSAVHQPRRVVLFGVPPWVILTLGLAGPIIFFRLRRMLYPRKRPS